MSETPEKRLSDASSYQAVGKAVDQSIIELPSQSYLEYAFLRWVLYPAVTPEFVERIRPQEVVAVGEHSYRLDYAVMGVDLHIAIELDGFAFHGNRDAFSYDRLRQNDLLAAGWETVRFSYDSIKDDTGRCVSQLQAVLARDPVLREYLLADPVVEQPDMPEDRLHALSGPPTSKSGPSSYFDLVRSKINLRTLRTCQSEAFWALAGYYGSGGPRAACIMAVGAGKTALGVAATLAFARRRALIVTPSNVIRGTFDRALDYKSPGNVLYGLPGGPLIPGAQPPKVLTIGADMGPVGGVSRNDLLAADIIATNFHSLGTSEDPGSLLARLEPGDIDFIVVDEAHIAAADSYQRLFAHFAGARVFLMSACFQRLDGRPIEADIVYRYRLIDAIADGNAKNLRVERFAPSARETVYEMAWPDGLREEVRGRDAILEIIRDERKLALMVAKSDTSIRRVMEEVRSCLDAQTKLLAPIRPRVLFSAIGERHADQVARIAEEYGIHCAYIHHSMTDRSIRDIRERFERESGDLQGIVQIKMLGQGYDFPPITVVVPMRPYGSFSEFYQFIGRGIRTLVHPALGEGAGSENQFVDIVYHAELGLDEHIETIYRENDMEPPPQRETPRDRPELGSLGDTATPRGTTVSDAPAGPETFVLFEPGDITTRVVHDEARVIARRAEREREALAARYSAYVQSSNSPVSFEQFCQLVEMLRES